MASKESYKDALIKLHAEYAKAAQKAKDAIEAISSGEVIMHLLVSSGGNPTGMQEGWQDIWRQSQEFIEDRNSKLEEFKTALRTEIGLDTSVKGPDGKAKIITIGNFVASSVTKRSFDGNLLLELLDSVGLKEEFLSQRVFDKDGKEISLASTETYIEYGPTINWLSSKNAHELIKKSYVEKASTPSVKGDKTIGKLGDIIS
jgi:hypothetical protein